MKTESFGVRLLTHADGDTEPNLNTINYTGATVNMLKIFGYSLLALPIVVVGGLYLNVVAQEIQAVAINADAIADLSNIELVDFKTSYLCMKAEEGGYYELDVPDDLHVPNQPLQYENKADYIRVSFQNSKTLILSPTPCADL